MLRITSIQYQAIGLSANKLGWCVALLFCLLLGSQPLKAEAAKSTLKFSDSLVDGIQCRNVTTPAAPKTKTKVCYVSTTTLFTMTFNIQTDQLNPLMLLGQVPIYVGNDKWSMSFSTSFKNIDKKTGLSVVTHTLTDSVPAPCATKPCPVTVTSLALMKFSPAGLSVTITRRAETMAGGYLDEADERSGVINTDDYVEVSVGDNFDQYFDVTVKGIGRSMDRPIVNSIDGSDTVTLRNVRVSGEGLLSNP